MWKRLALGFTLGMPTIATAIAAETPNSTISLQCEQALALSALPQRLRADASVYALTNGEFTLTRQGEGPFTCIVERNHAEALVPQCADAAGKDSVLPGIIRKSLWALQGMDPAERRSRFDALFEDGQLEAPSRPGVSYMMSDYNYVWNSRHGGLIRVPPHVMFYAPDIGNEDIGGSFEHGLMHNRGEPFIVEQGPHGYMISFVEHPSDSDNVRKACAGQLPDTPPDLGQLQAAGNDAD